MTTKQEAKGDTFSILSEWKQADRGNQCKIGCHRKIFTVTLQTENGGYINNRGRDLEETLRSSLLMIV